MINKLGAEYIDISDQKSLVGFSRQFDFIISTLNVQFDIDTYLKMLKPQGKFCLVAQPLEKLSVSTGLLYDYAQRTIYGNYTGSRRDMMDMIAFSAKRNVESFVEVIPFPKMNEALEMVRRGNVPIRVVLENQL